MVANFVVALRQHIQVDYQTNFPNLEVPPVAMEYGHKYVKILVGSYGNQNIHCFIDFSGNIFGPEYPKNPILQKIGSIYDKNFGVGFVIGTNGVIKP